MQSGGRGLQVGQGDREEGGERMEEAAPCPVCAVSHLYPSTSGFTVRLRVYEHPHIVLRMSAHLRTCAIL